MVFIILLDGVPYASADGQRCSWNSQDAAERVAVSLRENFAGEVKRVQVCPVPASVAGR